MWEGDPYDGHTLHQTWQQVESNTGAALRNVLIDKGYAGHDDKGEAKVHQSGTSKTREIRTTRQRRRRRSAIEPKIGHAKFKSWMRRCHLKGLKGDAANVVLAAAGANLRKLLKCLPCAGLGDMLIACRWLQRRGLVPVARPSHRPALANNRELSFKHAA